LRGQFAADIQLQIADIHVQGLFRLASSHAATPQARKDLFA
jgi:hypothetical protein